MLQVTRTIGALATGAAGLAMPALGFGAGSSLSTRASRLANRGFPARRSSISCKASPLIPGAIRANIARIKVNSGLTAITSKTFR
jgi:hypothetical protein